MARYDAYNSECLVFSFKDGLLARLAHDLKMQVERFSIEVDDSTRAIKSTFDPSSIAVVCAQVDGRDDPSTLSQGDKKKIYDNITKDVLRVRKHPEIRFDSTNVVARGEGGTCDACPLGGGVTTEEEMFILLGSYYVATP